MILLIFIIAVCTLFGGVAGAGFGSYGAASFVSALTLLFISFFMVNAK